MMLAYRYRAIYAGKEFYLKQGFAPTGEVLDDETVLRLVLSEV